MAFNQNFFVLILRTAIKEGQSNPGFEANECKSNDNASPGIDSDVNANANVNANSNANVNDITGANDTQYHCQDDLSRPRGKNNRMLNIQNNLNEP